MLALLLDIPFNRFAADIACCRKKIGRRPPHMFRDNILNNLFKPLFHRSSKDGKGGYRFDRMSLPAPFDILGFFLGYMSGPIMAESQEERKTRHSHIVELPEKSAPEE